MLQIAIDQTYLSQLLFEIFVFLLFFFILIHFSILWLKRKNKITQMLILWLFFYFIALGLTVFNQMNTRLLLAPLIPTELIYILDKIYKMIIFFANYYFYRFYLEIFAESAQKSRMNKLFLFLTGIGILVCLVSLFIDLDKYYIVDIALILHSFSLYFPTSKQTLQSFREIPKDDFNRYRFLFLCGMAISFILIWIANIFNVAWDYITLKLYGPFWLLGWIFVAIAAILAYLGFGMPKLFKNIMEKLSKN